MKRRLVGNDNFALWLKKNKLTKDPVNDKQGYLFSLQAEYAGDYKILVVGKETHYVVNVLQKFIKDNEMYLYEQTAGA